MVRKQNQGVWLTCPSVYTKRQVPKTQPGDRKRIPSDTMVDLRRCGRAHFSTKKNKELQSGEVIIASNTADSSRKTARRGKDTLDWKLGHCWPGKSNFSTLCCARS